MLVFNEKHILCQPNTENTKSVENANLCENPFRDSKVGYGYGRLREVTGGYGYGRLREVTGRLREVTGGPEVTRRLRLREVTGGYGRLQEVPGYLESTDSRDSRDS